MLTNLGHLFVTRAQLLDNVAEKGNVKENVSFLRRLERVQISAFGLVESRSVRNTSPHPCRKHVDLNERHVLPSGRDVPDVAFCIFLGWSLVIAHLATSVSHFPWPPLAVLPVLQESLKVVRVYTDVTAASRDKVTSMPCFDWDATEATRVSRKETGEDSASEHFQEQRALVEKTDLLEFL